MLSVPPDPVGEPAFPTLETLRGSTDRRGTLVELTQAAAPRYVWCRVFALSTKTPSIRGGHAHRSCSQALIALAGEVRVRSRGGFGSAEFDLALTTQVLIVPPMNWLEIDMGPDSVLLVLADRPYEPEDYVRDIDEFIHLVSRASI